MALATTCPADSSEVRHSRMHWYEWPLSFAFMALRCQKCGLRFWRTRSRRVPFVWFDSTVDVLWASLTAHPALPIVLGLILAGVTGSILGYVLSGLGI